MSVIIPNRNGAHTLPDTIGALLRASPPFSFEVIVVDDASTDGSVERLRSLPIHLIELARHGGTSKARNRGAAAARGDLLLFIDADCVVAGDTLARAEIAWRRTGSGTFIGGTYDEAPWDAGFWNRFQALFVHFNEMRAPDRPDYVAAHALVTDRHTFRRSGGFREDFLPILEDVELSHRARARGIRLRMETGLRVRHAFGFGFRSWLRNAARKAFWWAVYSAGHGDVAADSGTASHGLKAAAVAACGVPLLVGLTGLTGRLEPALAALAAAGAAVVANRHYLAFLFRREEPVRALRHALVYFGPFAAVAGVASAAGLLRGLARRRRPRTAARPAAGPALLRSLLNLLGLPSP